ncbi:hypothetical protein [Enterovirga sp. CN4-39]|uniref:hypothetical protein n=1 Tax=Enterovirga sp. CN4-39 TaxID=3400910 RepID=UPI003BFB8633
MEPNASPDNSALPSVFPGGSAGAPAAPLSFAPVGFDEINKGSDALDRPSLLGAAFRTENVVGSGIASNALGVSNDLDPIFDAWSAVKGTSFEPHWGRLSGALNPTRMAALMRDITREEEDRKTLAGSPVLGTLASMGASIVDVPTLLPGGALARGGALGYSVGRSALAVGAAAAAGTAVQEAGLQATQQTRPLTDTAIAIGGSAIVGGLLGAAGAHLFTNAEWNQLAKKADAVLQEAQGAQQRLSDFEAGAREAANNNMPLADAGAAAVPAPRIEDLTLSGKAARAVGAATAWLNPSLRLGSSPSPEVRAVSEKLLKNSLYLNMHDEGRTLGVAAETAMIEHMGAYARSVQAMDAIYGEARKSGLNIAPDEFNRVVGRAMRRNDTADPADAQLWEPVKRLVDESDDAYSARIRAAAEPVSRAAKAWRETLIEPLKEQAIKQGLLPEDVSVETAASYFSRVWRREMMVAQEGAFKAKVAEYYSRAVEGEYGKAVQSLTSRFSRIDRELEDLQLGPEQRTAALAEIEGRLEQLPSRVSTETIERADRLSQIRADLRLAREGGDTALVAQSRDAIKQIEQEGGQELVDFLKERATLRSRMNTVSMNTAGLRERSDEILNRLADLEEANLRSMGRLVQKGEQLQRELDRLDPERLEARVGQLRDQFEAAAQRAEASAERARRDIERVKTQAQRRLDKEATNAQRASVEAGLLPADQKAGKLGEASAARQRALETAAKRDAAVQARLEKEALRQARRAEDLTRIARRLETAERFDRQGILDEVMAGVGRLKEEVSGASLRRGERAARLTDRLKELDPARVEARVKTLAQMRKDIERRFYDTWEIARGGEGVDAAGGGKADFSEMGRTIADAVFDRLTGRDLQTMPSGLGITVKARGPLAERTFNVPDQLIEEFLEDDVSQVGKRYARVMGADVELARNFQGDPTLQKAIDAIKADYEKLRAGVSDEAQLRALDGRQKADIADIEALRDMLRGNVSASHAEQSFDRIVRVANMMNYVRLMGGVVVASLADVVRVPMVHGLKSLGVGPLAATLGSTLKKEAIQLSVREAQLAGNVLEKVHNSRLAAIIDVTDPYRTKSAAEVFMEKMTDVASKWNGIRKWTDTMKGWASVVTQNRVLEGVSRYGDLPASERRYLAFLGIDKNMAERIARLAEQHGNITEGVRVAGTAAWDDEAARRVFYGAINKDVDSIIIQQSRGDVPLFANTPLGRMALQFKSFALASNQRVLMRGLQEDQARFWGGVIASSAVGMMIAYIKAIESNRAHQLSDNPGYWLTEGLDRSGILAIPFELSNTAEKLNIYGAKRAAIDIGEVLFPGVSGKEGPSRYGSRGKMSSLFGPTVGFAEDVATVLSIPEALARDGEVKDVQRNAVKNLVPFGSYTGVKQFLNFAVLPPGN